MTNSQLSSLLVILVPQVIKEIVENDHISEEQAIDKFYNSIIYSKLAKDETKLWHLSPKALYTLYNQEQTTGIILYPEEA